MDCDASITRSEPWRSAWLARLSATERRENASWDSGSPS